MPEKPISIIGAPENATHACKKVMEIISQESVHQRGRGGDREIVKEDASPVALKMFLPNSVVGRIIGKAGIVIKQIMEDTQTKIHISSQPDVVDQNMGILRSNRIVTIRGTIEVKNLINLCL
jgi:polyribonucleotide nucleotidyltransferase